MNLPIGVSPTNSKAPEFQLYNLSTDPSEKTNLIKEHPEEAKRLKQELKALIEAGHSH